MLKINAGAGGCGFDFEGPAKMVNGLIDFTQVHQGLSQITVSGMKHRIGGDGFAEILYRLFEFSLSAQHDA